MKTPIQILVTAALALALALPAGASQLIPPDRLRQIRESDAIVKGTVVSIRSSWLPHRRGIVSDAEIVVEEAWKGLPGERVTVRTPGGVVDHVLLRVDGAAAFERGESVVVFLSRTGQGWTPSGMVFGKFRVVEGPAGDVAIGATLPGKSGHRRMGTVSLSLNELRGEVLAAVRKEIR